MIRTITLGSCVSIQGVFLRALSDGRIVIRSGERTWIGQPALV